jgi:hypothetical protein
MPYTGKHGDFHIPDRMARTSMQTDNHWNKKRTRQKGNDFFRQKALEFIYSRIALFITGQKRLISAENQMLWN